jgi:hypothetical protein
VGILLVLCLAVALVFYWRYREEESLYLQVGSQRKQLVRALWRSRDRLTPEAEFLDEIKTTDLRVFLLAIHSHLYIFDLSSPFLQTQATSHSFFS